MSSNAAGQPAAPPTPGQPLDRSRDADRAHYESVLDAEVARLVRVMREFRVARESTLRERTRADLWGGPGFEAALNRAVETGQLEDLLGFVRLPAEVPTDEVTHQDLLHRLTARWREHRAGGDASVSPVSSGD